MNDRELRTIASGRRRSPRKMLARAMAIVVSAAWPFAALARDEPVPTPAALTRILSCQSRDALETLADLLFLQNRPPAWMHASELPEPLDGMIGA